MDYTHNERTNVSPQQKIDFRVFVIAVIVFLTVFILTLLFAKEYISQVLSGVFGILAGSGIGYGYSKSKTNHHNHE